MIDLSHLTEEEKNMILAVLKRDAELKQAEDTRIRSLHKSVSDKAKLKYLTGEWFYETKSKRHQDRIHGSDIIRASMRQRKGVTILELSQMWTEKPSFVNSDNKEVFVPPELSGLIEEPAPRNSHDREHICNPADMLKPVLQSPTKRQNPFNSQAPAAETLESIASQLTNGAMEQTKTPGKGYHEDASPRRTKLKAMPQRPMSFSKSLEDLTSRSSTLPPRPPSFSDSEDMKMISASVSAIPQEEKDGRDSDCTSESSLYLGWRRNANSLSNLSLSSGMVSMSSAGSMVSIYSGEHGDVEVKGSIQLALNYVQKLGEFHIFVVHCRELAVADPKKNRSNPYIKCYLLPDKAKMGKKKTSVKNKTLNPTYNEILRFKVTMETLKTQKLNVSVWHNDNFGRNNFLGELELDLTEWDFNNTQINEYTLKPRVSTLTPSPSHSQSVDGRGEMRVALRFLPRVSYSKRPSKLEAGEMQVWVKDCKNLTSVRGVIIDPFVKCAVLPDSGKRTRQKTRVVKRTTSPMFNHTMVYDGFRPDDLREIAMEITVWDHDRLSNHFIGGLRIGIGSGRSYGADVAWMDSTAEEVGLWERMMQAQSEWVEAVLPLRMLLMARAK
ncbi:synaptotagmin-like protein 2 isoform X4 [Hypomesus transpacificus]|uniref:synaptotagmin-like protein 2 isoform X4 n=1 Tax=Hypomesus transpacificus TaxID=137520 RepID=UPI001F082839|nr:synaptotagmin-like protein 2 isoform X4 [Hypomesus transpacificus]